MSEDSPIMLRLQQWGQEAKTELEALHKQRDDLDTEIAALTRFVRAMTPPARRNRSGSSLPTEKQIASDKLAEVAAAIHESFPDSEFVKADVKALGFTETVATRALAVLRARELIRLAGKGGRTKQANLYKVRNLDGLVGGR